MVNTGLQIPPLDLFSFLLCIPTGRTAGSFESSIFNFGGKLHTSVFFVCLFFWFIVSAPVYVPTNSAAFLFPTALLRLATSYLADGSLSGKCTVIYHCAFDLPSLNDQ